MALKRLKKEYDSIIKEPNYFYSIEINSNNFYIWNIILIGPPDTLFDGAIIKCTLTFTNEYPNKPPIFKFNDKIFHPNIYNDGNICISILHNGVDEFGYENISERWKPSHSVNSILMSIISILNEPNLESPANVDASILWKNHFEDYKKIIYKYVANTQK
jgi:ubiquitin-conjugating enzyme E2 G1